MVDALGRARRIDANLVIFATGATGEEKPPQLDTDSLRVLARDKYNLAESIANAQRELKRGNRPPPLALPRILTYQDIEDLYELWEDYLGRESYLFPLRPLMRRGIKIAHVGGKDGSKVLAEILAKRGSPDAYPDDRDRLETPFQTIYNADPRIRQRYREISTDPMVKLDPNKVLTFRERYSSDEYGSSDLIGIRVFDSRRYADYDYVVVAPGYKKPSIAREMPLNPTRARDLFGQSVGLEVTKSLYIAGAATGFEIEDFPKQIQNIISILALTNTISLWANGILAERLAWTLATRKAPNREKLDRLLSLGPNSML